MSSISIAVCASIGHDFMNLHDAKLGVFALSTDIFGCKTSVFYLSKVG